MFARIGIDNTRINEITDEADVGFGTFYNHFASKEEIVEAVVAELFSHSATPSPPSPRGSRIRRRRVALLGTGGALLAVMREVLDGTAPKDAGRRHAEGVLRMLGLAPQEAAEVARRPMPAIPTGQT